MDSVSKRTLRHPGLKNNSWVQQQLKWVLWQKVDLHWKITNNPTIVIKLITNRWSWKLVPQKVSGGSHASMRHSREVSIVTLWAGASPACGHQPAPSHWRNFSGNTYLTPHLPVTDFQQGREGQGSKLLAKHCRNTAMLAKLEQMVNTSDSSARGEANPCGHPACIFVRKTTGHVDSRLTLPKLHLATL